MIFLQVLLVSSAKKYARLSHPNGVPVPTLWYVAEVKAGIGSR
jgi:hypothetical protein